MQRRPPSLPPAPPAPAAGTGGQIPGLVSADAHRMLGRLLMVLLLALPLMLIAEALGSARSVELYIFSGATAWVALLLWAHRRGRDDLALAGLVIVLITAAVLFGVAMGSVRTVGTIALPGAIVIAGIFLGVRALLVTLIACSAVVGGLIAAQIQGWLREPVYTVQAVHWFEFTIVFAMIAITVWYARRIAVRATARALDGEARLASVLRNVPIALVVSGVEAPQILEVNAAYERMFRLRRDEAIGSSSPELQLWPDPTQRSAMIAAVLRDGRVSDLEVRLRRRDGEEFDALLCSELVESAGQRVRVTTVVDVSEQRAARLALEASEARFRRLFDETPVASLITSYPEGRITACNDAFAVLVGRPREALVSRTVVGLGLWDNAQERTQAFARLQREGMVRDQSLRIRHADGTLRHAMLNWVFMEVEGERFILGQMIDLSARIAAEQALRELNEGLEARVQARTAELEASNMALAAARDAAEAATRAKSQFLANMSHEIRTPLNAVVGLTDLVLRSPGLPGAAEDHLQKVRRAALALLEIISPILDFSKLEAGGLQLEHAPFDLDQVLEAVRSVVAVTAQAKGLTLEIRAPAALTRQRLGDALRLTQVLINLAGNAVKFTPTGGVTIELDAAPAMADGSERVHFAVQDSGIGIAADKQHRLFQPFDQIDGSTTRRFGGTGLGLAIAREIVRAMGGEIEVRSEEGIGSRFSFTLELPCAAPAPAKPPAGGEGCMQALRGCRILLAEDNELNQMVARGFLEDLAEARLRVVATGAEALDALRDSDFDLVLMDVQMPVMDGYEATRRLRLDPRLAELPVIAMTAHAQPSDRERSLAAGMNGHITKPFEAHELFATLAAALKRPCVNDAEAAVRPPRA